MKKGRIVDVFDSCLKDFRSCQHVRISGGLVSKFAALLLPCAGFNLFEELFI